MPSNLSLDLQTAIWLLPFAFALHNFEEVLRMEKWTKTHRNPLHPPVTIAQFAVAVSLFTIIGFIIVFGKGLYDDDTQYYMVVSGFAGMLWLNVFFPHLLGAIYFRKYIPGLITALLINLPLTSFILVQMHLTQHLTYQQIILSSTIGGIVGFLSIFLFLKTGKSLTR